LIEHTSPQYNGLEAVNFKHMCELFRLISKPVEGIKTYRTLDPTLIPDKCTEQALSGMVAIEVMGLTR
jgi:hypothetical protein